MEYYSYTVSCDGSQTAVWRLYNTFDNICDAIDEYISQTEGEIVHNPHSREQLEYFLKEKGWVEYCYIMDGDIRFDYIISKATVKP